ncbi:glycosyl transferase family protein [Sphingomonas immobilis]|uniref:Glycosyl transferase family protein n=1 Tax=Sphingomonas immobilis TaxID=3063997 RepID=A0ABT8ZUT9_9SPHN|nr:glycosyl transferase family protein [Sphingomonas sp. CA1-15]MDO7841345.1 glycosyl transferase family protein [Sphingomonas sp. CA1-15]
MNVGEIAITAIDAVTRETMLFAAVGFLIGGLDDLLVDAVYLAVAARRRFGSARRPATIAGYPARAVPRRIAVFVAAWDESAVIGRMLRSTLERFEHDDYRIYVGTYPNDRETIAAAAAVAEKDDRVRVVIGSDKGPTTKADCLNAIWGALARDEATHGGRAVAVVIHDAEDVVHRHELRVFDALIDTHPTVQLPVVPLIERKKDLKAALVSGHYADEFADSHGKQMVVRHAIGAGLPLAGVGCAIARDALEALSGARNGRPFDAGSLTEDYELGLLVGQGTFARVRESEDGPLIAVHAYFPDTIEAAVKQKARWMTGIALAGWDRVGWSHIADWREHWMRMRDRRAPTAVLVLAAAYVALVAWGLSEVAHILSGTPAPGLAASVSLLLTVNLGLLLWRLASRALFTGMAYGPVEAVLSLPRALAGNLIALLAARRAVWRYVAMLRGAPLRWDKTTHAFPDDRTLAEEGLAG